MAVKVTEVPVQIGFEDAAIVILAGKLGFTVIVIALEVAGLPVTQEAFEVKTQVTISPLTKAALLYVVEFVPTFTPFNFHWYVGVVPPFVGVAVYVIEVPAQVGFAEAAILILATTFGLTVIVTVLEVAGLPVAQVAFDVILQVTVFPLASAAFVYVVEFIPTLIPFSFH